MHALIVDTEVVELRPEDDIFDVVSGWYWVPVPEKLHGQIETTWRYDRDTDTFSPPPPFVCSNMDHRTTQYPSYAEQLALLFDDMRDGIIPGKETSKWYAAIQAIKDTYPLE